MAYNLIGKNFTPVDVVAKVTGRAKYAEDFRADGMVFCKLLTSPMPHARIRNVDASEALKMPGVVAVLSHLNAPRLADSSDRELAVLQAGEVAFRGQYVAAVIADTLEGARYAASLIRVSYDEEPHDVGVRINF